jgi:hypothetical protein
VSRSLETTAIDSHVVEQLVTTHGDPYRRSRLTRYPTSFLDRIADSIVVRVRSRE